MGLGVLAPSFFGFSFGCTVFDCIADAWYPRGYLAACCLPIFATPLAAGRSPAAAVYAGVTVNVTYRASAVTRGARECVALVGSAVGRSKRPLEGRAASELSKEAAVGGGGSCDDAFC